MPRRSPDPLPSARALAVLSRRESRVRVDEGAPPVPVDPAWVRPFASSFVPTREEVVSGAPGPAVRNRPQPGRDDVGRRVRSRSRWSEVITVPSALRGMRWAPGRAAVIGALGVVLLAVAVFGLRVAWAQADARPTPVSPPLSTVVPGALASSSPTGSVTGERLIVHVVGQVRRPGIVTLPPGSRVVDAVRESGGATAEADLTAINLARLVVDGEQIRVPSPGEVVSGSGGTVGGGSGDGGAQGLVSLNSADVTALDSLPGIGPVLAQRIIDWRTANGRFTSVDELGEVSGIGEKLLAQLRSKVTL